MFYVLLLYFKKKFFLLFVFCSFFGCFDNRCLSFLFFFHLFCDNLPCSGMFRNVPECSMFRVLLTPILLSEHKSAANSLLLAREHSPDVNNKPISIPYLEQGYRWNIVVFNLKVES